MTSSPCMIVATIRAWASAEIGRLDTSFSSAVPSTRSGMPAATAAAIVPDAVDVWTAAPPGSIASTWPSIKLSSIPCKACTADSTCCACPGNA